MSRKSDVRDPPKDPVLLDRWLLERLDRSPHLPVPPLEKIDDFARDILSELESWARARRVRAGGATERLLLTWFRKRLPDLPATFADFRGFIVAEQASHPAWGMMHFITQWMVRREPVVLREIVSLQMVILTKIIEDQEKEARPAAMKLVRQLRALRAAATALKSGMDKQTEDRPNTEFWTSLDNRMNGALGEILGEDAATNLSTRLKGRLEANAPAPLAVAIQSVRKEWDDLFSKAAELTEKTLSAIQTNFMSETVVVQSHAPSKRGVRRRIVELSRVGLSQREIAAFEAMTTKAVAEHLRRARRSSQGTTQHS